MVVLYGTCTLAASIMQQNNKQLFVCCFILVPDTPATIYRTGSFLPLNFLLNLILRMF